MTNWKDTTSYSQGDKKRVPTTWTAEGTRLNITITKGHIYYPDKWVFHCRELGFDTFPIGSSKDITFNEAEKLVFKYLNAKLIRLRNDLNNLQGIRKGRG